MSKKILNFNVCQHCNKEFRVANWNKNTKYCSKECYIKGSRIKKKFCKCCNTEKPMEDFYRFMMYKRNTTQISKFCKECANKRKYIKTKKQFLQHSLIVAKSRAKKKNLEFNITYDYVLDLLKKQNNKCSLSGIDLTFLIGTGHDIDNALCSIDRIDSTKGYIIGNIQLICFQINKMKMDLDQNRFIELCKLIVNNKE